MVGLRRPSPPQPTLPARPAPRGEPAASLRDGLAFHQSGRLPEAVAAYTRVLEADPRSAEAHANRAAARYQLRDAPGAFADYAEALRLRPDYPEALNNRGVLRQATGDVSGAMQDFERALELDAGYGEALVHRGVLLNQRWEHSRAVVDFTRALELAPRNPSLLARRVLLTIVRGDAFYHLGRTAEAMADYRGAFAARPAYFAGFLCRTLAHSLARNGVDAMFADCDRHLSGRPDDFMTLARRAVMTILLGRTADADTRQCYATGDPADAAMFEALMARARSRVDAAAEGVAP